MLLITETTDHIEYLKETAEDGTKKLYIEGVFMQYDTPNKNGRIYPRFVMEKELNRYINENVKEKRAYGELNHPKEPQIDLNNVSHLIESLTMRNDGTVIGKAIIGNTPKGNIVRGLMEMGANLGVSTRGLGSLREGRNGIMEVQDDFRLITAADIVADPSAPSAFVKGIMENVEFFYNENTNEWVQRAKSELKKKSINEINECKLVYFKEFLKSL